MDWFKSWFNTPYYHMLYNNRDYTEAEKFMSNLIDKLEINKGSKVLDLACGKGRHSVYLNSKGLTVVGADLSKESIQYAKKFEKEDLFFIVHDMRLDCEQYFDYVFNLFTSFGYFDNSKEDLEVLETINHALKDGGTAVIDFMNTDKVVKNLVPSEVQERGDIKFNIKRFTEGGFICKNIQFEDKGEKFNCTERVKILSLEDFKGYFEQAGLKLLTTYGDYDLNEFDKEKSDRLIMILSK